MATLAVFRKDEWVSQIGAGLTTVGVTVLQSAIEHQIKVRDFLARLRKRGSSPGEVALKQC
jgi:hypothetical protein